MDRPALRLPRRRAFVFPVLAALVAIVAPREARAASSVTGEVGGGQSKPTPTIASAPFEYQKFAGRWQASDALSFAASMRLTHDFAGAPTGGTVLRAGSDWVWQGALGVSADVSSHVALGLDVSGSPSARRDVVSSLTYAPRGGQGTTVDTSTVATGWNAGVAIDAAYDTFDEEEEHAVDVTVDASAAYTHFGSEQRLGAVEEPAGVLAADTIAAQCSGRSTTRCNAYGDAAAPKRSTLEQARLGVTTTLTLWDHTEVGADVAYYVYDRGSPGDAGFFAGTLPGGGATSWGAGMPVLPTRWSLRPELGQRWSWITVRAFYQFASYAVVPSEVGHTVGGKVTLLPGKWRPYVTGNVREDVAGGSAGSSSWSIGAGIQRVL